MLQEMLKAEGFQVDSADTGSRGVERLRGGERFDLVLTDWRLPGADGLAVLDAAIAMDSTLPVIVMTAYGSIETAVEAMKHGAEDFITKPVDPDLLRLLVSRAIERRARSRESLLFAEAQSRAMPPIVGESAGDPVGPRRDRARRRDRRHGSSRGRKRHRQGALRPGDPRALGPPGRSVRRHQLRRHSRDPSRERALRPRARAPSRAPRRAGWASSSWPIPARSFSTRSASFRRPLRASCSGCSRSGRFTASGARSRSRSTCGSSRRRTGRSTSSCPRVSFARTCSTACASSRSGSPRCASGPRTSTRSSTGTSNTCPTS